MADVSKLRRRRNLLGSPPTEPSPNLAQPEAVPADTPLLPRWRSAPNDRTADDSGHRRPDGRSMRRTNRTMQFATRVTPEFDRRVRAIAQRGGLMIVEVLEQALDAYERELSGSNKTNDN